ncbi:MAG: DUF2887 domain-containing protein [Cyanobacteria bacterium RI_101]|nr:DUF2887 domain-containing protein [Cyanobacteria bacterium RI_101]
METDKWFYELFLSQPGAVAELMPGLPPDCRYRYSAPALKATELRLDGVLLPTEDDPELPTIFLEAQMQRDEGFYRRYFAGIFLYLRQYPLNRPWRGLVIARSRRQILGTELPYEDLLAGRVTRLYLNELKNRQGLTPHLALLQLLTANQNKAEAISRQVLDSAENPEAFRRYLSLIESILANKFPQMTTEEITRMLGLKSADITQSRFYQEIRQAGLDEGRQAGLHEGLEREARLVIRQLGRRLGPLPPEIQTQILSLPPTALENLGEALLDFAALADLTGYLAEGEQDTL